MAKIDFNTVLSGEYEPRVGDVYEIAPGKTGKMKPPTGGLQKEVLDAVQEIKDGESEATDLDLCYIILDGLESGLTQEDVVAGMPSTAVSDFFILLTKIAERLGADIRQSKDSPRTNE